jgi:Peptidase family M28
VVDLRLYRIAFVPALIALVVLLFSLQSQPDPLRPLVAPAGFDGSTAAGFARQIVARAPDRTPGSSGDLRAAAMVERAFRRVAAGQVVTQSFGPGGRLRNVILKLPGQSSDEIVLIAPRDTAAPPGAASSAAATGALEELASNIGSSQHAKTLVLVSTDGSTEGALGAKTLADDYLNSQTVDAIVALEQPGAASIRQPVVLTSSTAANSTSFQLVRSAEAALTEQAGLRAHEPGPFGQLAELALPGGLGEQAVLIARGFDAVGLSSAGESPIRPAADRRDDLSPRTLKKFGQTSFGLVLALDSISGAPAHGPGSYVSLAGNLVPGWALAALALALIAPALLAAVDALARAGRRRAAGVAIRWASIQPLPLIAALGLLYVLSLTEAVQRPAFPFDPGRYGIGPTELLAICALAILAGGVWLRIGRNRLPVRLVPEAGAAALGLCGALAAVAIWIVNPYLALLLVPLVHLWVLQAWVGRRPSVAAAVAVALVPVALGALSVAGRLDLGTALPWHLLLAIGDWGVRVPIAIAGCVLAGSVAALVVLAGAGPEAGPPGPVRAPTPRRADVEVPVGAGAPVGGGWTNSRSMATVGEPIYASESRNRLIRENGGARNGPERESRSTEDSDQRRALPRGLGRGRTRDAAEGESDQARADRARGRRRS